MTTKLTITVPDAVAEAAKSIAGESGTTVSAMAAQGLRDQVTKAAAAAYPRWLAENPDIAAEVDEFRGRVGTDLHERWARRDAAA